MLADPAVMVAACLKAGIVISLAACQALLSGSDVSAEMPFSAMARLGLKLVQEPA
ncbi:hypothetical protein D3C87_2115480 [compost metagenome]